MLYHIKGSRCAYARTLYIGYIKFGVILQSEFINNTKKTYAYVVNKQLCQAWIEYKSIIFILVF